MGEELSLTDEYRKRCFVLEPIPYEDAGNCYMTMKDLVHCVNLVGTVHQSLGGSALILKAISLWLKCY